MQSTIPTAAYSTFTAAFTVGQTKRPDIFQPRDSPGPCAYGPLNLDVQKHRSPEWRISEAKKVSQFDITQTHPSPAQYEAQNTIGTGTKCTISQSTPSLPKPTIPSPALYQPKLDYVKKVTPSISVTQRAWPVFKKTFEETPGPGAYDQTAIGFASELFQVKRTGKLTQFGMAAKDSIYRKDASKIPAPWQYEPSDKLKVESPSFRFQKSTRQENLVTKQYEQNGPAMYNTSKDLLSSSRRSQTLQTSRYSDSQKSRSIQLNPEDLSPGPGAYEQNLSNAFSTTISTKFGSALRNTTIGQGEKSPGPGHYNISNSPRHMKSSSHNTFGEAKKVSSIEPILTPGPGSYEVISKKKEGPYIGIGKNFNPQSIFVNPSKNPGPGAYSICETQTKPESGGVVFNSKSYPNSKTGVPGPGSYDLPIDPFRTSKISFASNTIRDAFGIKEEGPSPASYDIRPTIAGMPEYHKKQIDYFKNYIQTQRNKFDFKPQKMGTSVRSNSNYDESNSDRS